MSTDPDLAGGSFPPYNIRLVANDANNRGDVFTNLIVSYFATLGYESVARLNVQKAGREIDLEVGHRTESKIAIGECKATREKLGGDDINKFAGALEVERERRVDVDVHGYVLSLSGFRQTAMEQEREFKSPRLILVDGGQIAQQLIHGRVLAAPAKAIDIANRSAVSPPDSAVLDSSLELLAHRVGFVWVVYYRTGAAQSHFTLVHADGESIATDLAEEIVQDDRLAGGGLHRLARLPRVDEIPASRVAAAIQTYKDYLPERMSRLHA